MNRQLSMCLLVVYGAILYSSCSIKSVFITLSTLSLDLQIHARQHRGHDSEFMQLLPYTASWSRAALGSIPARNQALVRWSVHPCTAVDAFEPFKRAEDMYAEPALEAAACAH